MASPLTCRATIPGRDTSVTPAGAGRFSGAARGLTLRPMPTQLSVNLNKIAVLRNSRGGDEPSVMAAARCVMAAGAAGITVHPRPDQRHIREADVRELGAWLGEGVGEFNIEGNPFAPPRAGYPGLLDLARATGPTQVTLVPDGDGQVTSDHGFDLGRDASRLAPLVAGFKAVGCRVSAFVDAGCAGLEQAAAIGIDRIEIYTGPYAHAWQDGDARAELERCRRTALQAQALGLGVNAGHDLSQANLGDFLAAVPDVLEVSIGHALIGEALYQGLESTVRAYLRIIG
jgi:pyridoxine 5-phosphate synthase